MKYIRRQDADEISKQHDQCDRGKKRDGNVRSIDGSEENDAPI